MAGVWNVAPGMEAGQAKRTGPGRKNVADVARDFGLLPP